MEVFFPNAPRMLTLKGYDPKLNAENEKRLKLDFIMPLNDQNYKGAPGQVADAFLAVGKLESGITSVGISSEFEGLTVEFFATPDQQTPVLTIGGATIRSLEVTRPDAAQLNEGDVHLTFNTNVPTTEELLLWAHRNHGATVFARFTATQGTLDLQPAEHTGDDMPTMPPENAKAVASLGKTKGSKKSGKDAAAGEGAEAEQAPEPAAVQ
jgi:hypothetical protein